MIAVENIEQELLNRKDQIIAGNRHAIVPHRIWAKRKVIDGAIGGCPPGLRQIGLRQPPRIKLDQSAE